ncbi:MAG: 50S ribosomal protein L19 [Candidatus Giovannonibacteria bacterium GW2011_GWA2_45_21]|uniref:Large ribosomal subunit protein bL19 n=1 Tax=Candidatus Giovannonibacteria bacterium GW2011_GWA2_45_21 TaxID=1618649 RepID=A0A0G1M874_9BACT|nr:MAG: 50S ribosomal protein L19 [Candidatus Giovannonibacteria bacterium GW2011_GWA2_45_21]
MDKIQTFNQKNLKSNTSQIKSGMKIRVWQKIKDSSGIGVEKIIPFHAPTIDKVEILSQAKVRRTKLYYLRGRIGKKSKMKQIVLAEAVESIKNQLNAQVEELADSQA